MNRREFLKSLIAAGVAAATTNIETVLSDTKHLSDDEFITYLTWSMNLFVHNPGQCAIITNIGEG